MSTMSEPALPAAVRERFRLIDASAALHDDFAAAVRSGLSATKKHLPCRYLYDAVGSELFERICELPEYTLARDEQAILVAHAADIARDAPTGAVLIELGSGSSQKTRTLIEALIVRDGRLTYVPIDIARSTLEKSARALLGEYPALDIMALAAEYRTGLHELRRVSSRPKLVAWLGSSVGNFSRAKAASLLTTVRGVLEPTDRLVLGADLRKPTALLQAAYDDAAGVTARFNLNLLTRINRELGGHFRLEAFAHQARWEDRRGRIVMALVSRTAQTVAIDALEMSVSFLAGERIITESSYKYDPAELDRLARSAGFAVSRQWLDEARRFSVSLLAPASG